MGAGRIGLTQPQRYDKFSCLQNGDSDFLFLGIWK
jgi:hypothetical protein